MIATRSHSRSRLVEVVRRQQDRHLVAIAQAGDHVEQLVADAGVEPDRRLVQEQHLRLGDERPGDLEPPPLAAAVAVAPAGRRSSASPSAATSSAMLRCVWDCDTPHRRACSSRLRAAAQAAVDDRLLEDDARDRARPRAALAPTS